MNEIALREASGKDVATIVGLVRSAFAEYRGRIEPVPSALAENAEHVRRKMEAARVTLAVQEDLPVGCVFHELRDDHLYFFRLAVLPLNRRQGIGRPDGFKPFFCCWLFEGDGFKVGHKGSGRTQDSFDRTKTTHEVNPQMQAIPI